MTDQEKDPAPETEPEVKPQPSANEAPANGAQAGDVAISEAATGTDTAAPAVAPLTISRPPVAKILVGIAAALALWFLAGIAGGVKQQACLASVTAKYGTGATGGKAGVADLARKNNAAKCTSSPF